MNTNLVLALLSMILSIFITGCGEEQHEDQTIKNVIAGDQLKALEKAKDVEQVLLDAAQQRREMTE